MKNVLISTSVITLLCLSANNALAGSKYRQHTNTNSFEDTARVTYIEPIYKTVRVSSPEEQCYRKPARHSHRNQNQSYTSTIGGSIVGGVIGNQFGGGNGKKIMTVAGALLGGSIGNDLRQHPNTYSHKTHRNKCHITQRYYNEERISGYLVTYKYKGKRYTTEMDHRPGKHLPVEVTVRPSRHYY